MEDKRTPVVSIITPVYNLEKYITETMDCVLGQAFQDWELLLVEDCSTDNTAAVIMDYLKETGEDRIRFASLS